VFALGWAIGSAGCFPAAAAAVAQAPPRPWVASQPASRPTAEDRAAQGRARRVAGDVAGAIRLLTEALGQAPGNVGYATELARAYAAERGWLAVDRLLSPLQDGLDVDGLLLLAEACAETGQVARAAEVLEHGLRSRPDSEALWLALIDDALARRCWALVLERVAQAERRLGFRPHLQFRAAQAYYRLGQAWGRTRVIRVPGGRAGQFVNDWLLLERQDQADRFLCCPPASALYALRRALDAGLDEPAAHLLHARIWQQAGRPEIGLAILQSREARWLESASADALATFAEVALAANALDDFLRYARLHAARAPQQRAGILFDACVAAAEQYNQRGDLTMSREFLRRAVALRPEDVTVMLRLADAVWDAGGSEEAAIWYRRVLEREPAHAERRRILERLGE
jgi:tetratricopeptide (TPR) repeat protein